MGLLWFLVADFQAMKRPAIRDKGAQLEACARIRNDDASERKFAEIRLRAIRKIGELSRELDKAKPGPKDNGDRSPETKAAALKQAGIPIRTAHRCKVLANQRNGVRVAVEQHLR